MKQIKLTPFDLDKAKNGAKIVTKEGYPVRITCYDVEDKDLPILAVIKNKEGKEIPYQFTIEGNFYINKDEHPFDLFIEEEQEKTRRTYSGTDSIYVPKDDEGIREELIDAINGLWNDDALPMPLSIKRKDAWLAWLDNKPKFNVGDWVVTTDGKINQVKSVSHDGYSYTLDDNTYFSGSWKDMYHHWSIKDAKPGDVLASDDLIVIFKEIDRANLGLNIKCHCTYTVSPRPFFLVNTIYFTGVFHPATQEQRNLLFQKMKEAGYEWDEERKELKNIVPKFKVDDKVVLKCDNSCVGSIADVSLEGTYCVKFEDSSTGWYSGQKLEPLHNTEKVKPRRMTNQELSWWLRDCPEEHREFRYAGDKDVYNTYDYPENEANTPVENIHIRKNGSEWEEPLVEI